MPLVRSKVDDAGLGDKVQRLYSQGFSYRHISDIIRKEDNVYLNHQTISNYLHKIGKYHSATRPKYLIEEFRKFLNDLEFQLNLCKSLKSNEKYAIMTYLKRIARAYESKLNRENTSSGVPEYEQVCNLIVELSNHLCLDCRQCVVKLVDEEMDRRQSKE